MQNSRSVSRKTTQLTENLPKSEVASQISDELLALRAKAKEADLKYLVYFIEMAFHEAYTQANKDEAEP